MINVLQRLAELDAKNPNIVKESADLAECGMMGMEQMGGMERPHTPASMNITANSGEELSGMLRDIMQLAGLQKVGSTDLGNEPEVAIVGADQDMPVGPAVASTAGEKMRSVLDKMNPDIDGDGDGDAEPEDADEGLVGGALGGIAGGMLGGPAGAAAGYAAGSKFGDDLSDDEKDESYDNTPNDPTDTNEFDPEQYAHHENPRGADRKGNSNNPRAYDTNESIAQRLMAEYKQFIGESADEEADEDVEEGMMDKAKAFGKKVLDKVGHGDDEDLIKDLQKKAGVPQTGKKPEKK